MNTTLGASRALLAALLVALFTVSAPVAHAQATSDNDSIAVPRITKGSVGNWVRVQRSSSQARRYFAPSSQKLMLFGVNCPGTVCPFTRDCYTTKGALGAGCIRN